LRGLFKSHRFREAATAKTTDAGAEKDGKFRSVLKFNPGKLAAARSNGFAFPPRLFPCPRQACSSSPVFILCDCSRLSAALSAAGERRGFSGGCAKGRLKRVTKLVVRPE
jgi:hypothetical protein